MPFIEDLERDSYSFLLPFQKTLGKSNPLPLCSTDELNRWFEALHPENPTLQDGEAWTNAYYKGEKLLRKTAWVTLLEGCQCEYGYSDTWQVQATHTQFLRVVREMTERIAQTTGCTSINCCNLNYYPRGGGVGFHADDEFLFDSQQRPTCIISLSLCRGVGKEPGGERRFQVKLQQPGESEDIAQRTTSETQISEVVLRNGDLLTMEGMFQKHYFHSVWPGDSKSHLDDPLTQGERINLTWRTIVQHLDGSQECRGKTCPLA